jgi:hypothetical protein
MLSYVALIFSAVKESASWFMAGELRNIQVSYKHDEMGKVR